MVPAKSVPSTIADAVSGGNSLRDDSPDVVRIFSISLPDGSKVASREDNRRNCDDWVSGFLARIVSRNGP